MENIEQYNEEQFQMLRLSVANTTSGICLFQSDDVEEQVRIAQRLCDELEKTCCILDMSHTKSEDWPDEIGKLRNLLAGHTDAEAVILCNLQVCGTSEGDKEYIKKFNYMRDQMLSMKKSWVFGMSPYFAAVLSREARDLYSCIMNHFTFRENESGQTMAYAETEFTGDQKLLLYRFKGMKKQVVRDGVENTLNSTLLQLVSVWNKLSEYGNGETMRWICNVLTVLEERISREELTAEDCLAYQEAVSAWLKMRETKKAWYLEKKIKERAELLLPERSAQKAALYQKMGHICVDLNKYQKAERYTLLAIDYYDENGMENSEEKFQTVNILALTKVMERKAGEAAEIYRKLIKKSEEVFGEDYAYLAILWNNLGVAYFAQQEFSEALEAFLKTSAFGSRGIESKGNNLRNIGYTYEKIGDYRNAAFYLRKAEDELEKISSAAGAAAILKFIYSHLADIYKRLEMDELSLFYTKKARQS